MNTSTRFHHYLAFAALSAATEGAGQPAADTAVATITVQGMEFEVDWPYKEGHVVTAGEASALNQTRAENLRNNFAPTIKKAMEEYRKANSLADDAEVPVASLDQDALQSKFDEYAEKYEFGVRTAGGTRTPMDPIGREAHRIATERVKAALQKKGITINSVPKEKMAAFVKDVIAKYPDVTEEAKRRVEAVSAVALDSIGL